MSRVLLCTIAAVVCCTLNAATVTVSTQLHDGICATEAELSFRRVVSAADTGKAEADLRVSIALNEPVSLELEEGHWALDIEADGAWHRRQYFSVHHNTNVTAELSPASTIRGRVRKDGPRRATLWFEPARPGQGLSGETVCAFDDTAFTCRVPAGSYHARLRAPKHVAVYVAAVDAPAGRVANLGEIAFKPGQAIIGRVEAARGENANLREVTVTAKPRRGATSTAVSVKPDRNGFFHVDGIAPGEHILSASHPSRLTTGDVSITVVQGAESELARPLVLARPRTVSLVVTPPLGPDGSPWRAILTRLLDDPVAEEIETAQVRTDGTWSFSRLQPGRYSVELMNAEARLAYERFDLEVDLTLPIVARTRLLHGRVILGDRPIEAHIELTDGAARTAKAESDDTGRFTMILPDTKPKRWTARVTTDIPSLDRKLQFDELPSEDHELVIHLQNLSLTGMTVDREQKPVSAIVNIVSDAGLVDDLEYVQRFPGEDGTFDVHGLAPGTYRLQAEGDGRLSDAVEVVVSEAQPLAEVVLVLKPATFVRGVVVSPLGPVAGARVWVRPSEAESMYTLTLITDPRGRFSAQLPPNVLEYDVQIAASGFAHTMGHLRHEPKRTVVADVQQNGGAITVRAPQGALLKYAGAATDVDTLRYVWHTTTNENGSTTIAAMEPGAYSLCKGLSCVDGFLPPFGDLTLELK